MYVWLCDWTIHFWNSFVYPAFVSVGFHKMILIKYQQGIPKLNRKRPNLQQNRVYKTYPVKRVVLQTDSLVAGIAVVSQLKCLLLRRIRAKGSSRGSDGSCSRSGCGCSGAHREQQECDGSDDNQSPDNCSYYNSCNGGRAQTYCIKQWENVAN